MVRHQPNGNPKMAQPMPTSPQPLAKQGSPKQKMNVDEAVIPSTKTNEWITKQLDLLNLQHRFLDVIDIKWKTPFKPNLMNETNTKKLL